MPAVSSLRLNLLRALYLLIAVGLGIVVWPGVIRHEQPWELMQGFVNCMLAAFGVLCALGVRYPLRMLPVLLWELLWKALWLLVVGVPALRAGPLSPAMAENLFAVGLVVLIPLALPWRYVIATYFRGPGEQSLRAGAAPN
ncbi:hypothetical protein G4G28_21700 [Massilia sp. Dwa41.01b]|uniref:hypothetical protein n=1 Tax=unclassified Massilia TaxID=2609279 RepID=UPI00160323C3|nr:MULTISPECIES: hypothetical protein [unclassified Massilia]QNA90460.1 hypothetical protein G4G28_21700 [Massilia sp. Dwa41.01b]QNA97691.1 hypothetical protein G4G31_00785 [Massilia sp. Se16.2.3]